MNIRYRLDELRPDPLCPKCGADGFRDVTPNYREADEVYYVNVTGGPFDHGRAERLEWACKVCDYTVDTVTADSEMASPHS